MTRSASNPTTQVAVGIRLRGEVVFAGVLLVDRRSTGSTDQSTGRFRYVGSYLQRPDAVSLDPVSLPLGAQEHRFSRFGGLPPPLRDSAPDNWGRFVASAQHRHRCLQRGIIPQALLEVDYLLLSPSDRIGNLIFSSKIPPDWGDMEVDVDAASSLPEVRDAMVQALAAQASQTPPSAQDIQRLATGTGGARPKISRVVQEQLHLVKFPGPGDQPSAARVEAFSLALAQRCGLTVCDARVARVQPSSTTGSAGPSEALVVRRFDRDGAEPLQMISAMTALGADDDAFRRDRWSYPVLAEELGRWSSDPAADRLQLFRCMVLHALLSDNDDHPRNYALVRDLRQHPTGDARGGGLGGWRLAPLYDLVAGQSAAEGDAAAPVEYLAMEGGRLGRQISRANFASMAAPFGLRPDQALAEIDRLEQVVAAEWPALAERFGLPEAVQAKLRAVIKPIDGRSSDGPMARLLAGATRESPAAARERAGS